MPEVDKLNIVYKNRSEPYEDFFGEMAITDKQKNKRIRTAEELEADILFFLYLILSYHKNGYTVFLSALEQFENRYRKTIAKVIKDEVFLEWYPVDFANNMLNATLRNIDDPWYTSEDRAKYNAENETNTVLNRADFQNAKAQGYKNKTWIDMADERVRVTHQMVGGRTIPIDDLFVVGAALMRFPRDIELAADYPEEIVACRCTILYH